VRHRERPRRPSVSLGSALVRRGWILVLSAAAVAAIGYAVAGLQSATYTAQATLSVSPAVGQANPGNAQQATQLAATYARAIPDDERLERLVGGQARSRAHDNISAASTDDSSVLRVTFTADGRGNAIKGARAIADALSSPRQLTSSVTPGTLQIVRRPATATTVTSVTGGVRYKARAVLLVPSGASRAATLSADQANKLAITYAALIPQDTAVVGAVARDVDESRDEVQRDLSVISEKDTSLLRVSYQSDSPSAARAGARATTGAVSGATPASSAILPLSLQTVSVPRGAGAPTTKGKAPAVTIGALIGLALGLVLLVAWERSDPHIRDPRGLSAHIGCPATPVDRLSGGAAKALLERWSALTPNRPARVAVLPGDAGMEAATDAVIGRLVQGGGGIATVQDAYSSGHGDVDASGNGSHADADADADVALVRAGAVGGARAGQAVALGCDLTVVVVPMGIKAADVRSLAEDLGDFGIVPVWALLSPRRSSRVMATTQRESVLAG
jgi:capsular polysaccharide biosynthesis protein